MFVKEGETVEGLIVYLAHGYLVNLEGWKRLNFQLKIDFYERGVGLFSIRRTNETTKNLQSQYLNTDTNQSLPKHTSGLDTTYESQNQKDFLRLKPP